jgi:hypothetical protein
MADILVAVHLKSSDLKSVNQGLVFLFRTISAAAGRGRCNNAMRCDT